MGALPQRHIVRMNIQRRKKRLITDNIRNFYRLSGSRRNFFISSLGGGGKRKPARFRRRIWFFIAGRGFPFLKEPAASALSDKIIVKTYKNSAKINKFLFRFCMFPLPTENLRPFLLLVNFSGRLRNSSHPS